MFKYSFTALYCVYPVYHLLENATDVPSIFRPTSPPCEMSTWLGWFPIGCRETARDRYGLQKKGITHILNAAEGTWNNVDTGADYYSGMNVDYYGIVAEDIPTFDLSVHFYPAAEYIDRVLSNPESMLMTSCFVISTVIRGKFICNRQDDHRSSIIWIHSWIDIKLFGMYMELEIAISLTDSQEHLFFLSQISSWFIA